MDSGAKDETGHEREEEIDDQGDGDRDMDDAHREAFALVASFSLDGQQLWCGNETT